MILRSFLRIDCPGAAIAREHRQPPREQVTEGDAVDERSRRIAAQKAVVSQTTHAEDGGTSAEPRKRITDFVELRHSDCRASICISSRRALITGDSICCSAFRLAALANAGIPELHFVHRFSCRGAIGLCQNLLHNSCVVTAPAWASCSFRERCRSRE
jgi:hypothetical protein